MLRKMRAPAAGTVSAASTVLVARLICCLPMDDEQQRLQTGIAALEGQRGVLGDAVVNAAVAGLRARLAELRTLGRAAEPEQSLKQATILFLDVVGSTALGQRLDPEEISAVMDGALSRGTTIVEAHGGKVLKYAGDNLLAAFGVDGAAEDDAERAVRSGCTSCPRSALAAARCRA